jgi:hypothetical protein
MATSRLNINIHTSLHLLLIVFHIWLVFKQGEFLDIFFIMYRTVLYSTLFHLLPLRLHSINGCWELS